MAISAKAVKDLRETTGAGMMDCKNALTETDGDPAAAEKVLREKGIASASKRAGRTANEGAVASYIHMGGKIAVRDVSLSSDHLKTGDITARGWQSFANQMGV